MGPENPFASPKSDPLETRLSFDGLRYDKGVLVLPRETPLPAFCIKCGAPADESEVLPFRWHHPAVYATLFVNVLLYAIAAHLASEHVSMEVPLCARHAARRRAMKRVAFSGATVTIALVLGFVTSCDVVFASRYPGALEGMIAGCLLACTIGLIAALGMRTLVIEKIDNQAVHLARLPEAVIRPLFP